MEVRINKEVRNYTESIFFGLNARQFLFSALACLSALAAYSVTNRYFGTETVSWICIFSALPFALTGFLRFQQMKAEEIMKHILFSFLLEHRDLIDRPFALYDELFKDIRERDRKASLRFDRQLLKEKRRKEREERNREKKKQKNI